FVIGMHVLQHSRNTLQAHAGVHTRLGQRRHGAVGGTLELHEHQIPYFDIAVAVFFRRSGRATPNVSAVIVEDFRTRTTGAGIGHLPEVVRVVAYATLIADADDALFGHTNFRSPDRSEEHTSELQSRENLVCRL